MHSSNCLCTSACKRDDLSLSSETGGCLVELSLPKSSPNKGAACVDRAYYCKLDPEALFDLQPEEVFQEEKTGLAKSHSSTMNILGSSMRIREPRIV